MPNKLYNVTIFFTDQARHASTFHNVGGGFDGRTGIDKFVRYANEKHQWNFINIFEKYKAKGSDGKHLTSYVGTVYSDSFKKYLQAKGMDKLPQHQIF